VSFILDALRKSEHERQRSAVPGLSQVPLATPQPQIPRWTLVVIGVLVAAVLILGGAWWQSARAPVALDPSSAATRERSGELPSAPTPSAAPSTEPARPIVSEPSASDAPSLASAAAPEIAPSTARENDPPAFAAPRLDLPADRPALPSAAALAAEGVALPSLRLELHAYSERPRDRFVFINGRKYAEGERLTEGPQLLAIEPTGAVLAHAGRRFMLVQE
jgi:general secretion pathway protein B